jgi:hypothetical protein
MFRFSFTIALSGLTDLFRGKLIVKMCFGGIDESAITVWVDEWIRLGAILHAFVLLDHSVIATVRAQKHIALERTEGLERLLVVLSDA